MLAIAIAGIVAIVDNERVKDVTERALRYDLEVEDEGDDLRVAVLDVRHYHRNIVFDGASEHRGGGLRPGLRPVDGGDRRAGGVGAHRPNGAAAGLASASWPSATTTTSDPAIALYTERPGGVSPGQ